VRQCPGAFLSPCEWSRRCSRKEGFAAVLPPNAVMLVDGLTEHLKDLAHPPPLAEMMLLDHDDVADLGRRLGRLSTAA
jgi:hypothetical protein